MHKSETGKFSRNGRKAAMTPAADFHCDTVQLILKGYDLSSRNSTGHIDIPRMIEAGIALQVFACFIEPHWKRKVFYDKAFSMISSLKQHITGNHHAMRLVYSAGDLDKPEGGKIKALIGIEGGHHCDGSLKALDSFAAQGVRVFNLTWNNSNFLATSCKDADHKKKGLTAAGRKAVKKLNSQGIAVDLSHSGIRTFRDVMELSAKPPLVSHSCAYSLCPVPRNLSDEQARMLAERDGLIGIAFYQKFLRKTAWKDAGLSDVADHIRYFYDLIGPGHIALGADFDGMRYPAKGLSDVSCLPKLWDALLERGIPEKDLRSIWYDNAIRYLKSVLPA